MICAKIPFTSSSPSPSNWQMLLMAFVVEFSSEMQAANYLTISDRVDRVNHTYSGRQVIEAFLQDEKTIDFVAVFSVKRANRGSWDISRGPRAWYLYLFEQKKFQDELIWPSFTFARRTSCEVSCDEAAELGGAGCV